MTQEKMDEIRGTTGASAAQRAKLYDTHVHDLLAEVEDLQRKLDRVQADPVVMSKLEAAAKIDPNHLHRLLALERAVVGVGYCGMPTAG